MGEEREKEGGEETHTVDLQCLFTSPGGLRDLYENVLSFFVLHPAYCKQPWKENWESQLCRKTRRRQRS